MPWRFRPPSLSAGLPIAALISVLAALSGGPALAAPPPRPVSTSVLVPRVMAPAPGSFESALRRRLENEGRRQKLDLDMPFLVAPLEDDEPPEPGRGRRVERTILKALRGALDERLEAAARGSAAFAPLFRWIDDRDGGAPGWSTSPTAAARPESAPANLHEASPGPASRGVGDFALRFRLDAHPRLLLGARLGSVTGRIEVPLLERELRMSLDRPIGHHGRATFRGGRSDDRGEWADLSLQFRF